MFGETLSVLLSFTTLGMIIAAKVDINSLDLDSSPRAFYDLKHSNSSPLIPIQILVVIADCILFTLALRTYLKRKSPLALSMENSPFSNYCVNQSFIFLTKGVGLMLLMIFVIICLLDLENVSELYSYDISYQRIESEISDLATLLEVHFILSFFMYTIMLILCGTGCFNAGQRASKVVDAL
ncbi:unnamed protein product [Blepharisma stoltei]|uniref:Uncharacterized protein n=1 Tax=Blepharisma stoltei TaxID=1481888 RepID=A0AAU9IGT1_9CILI|nr:unnamed protein product [Blepharisma stoltei]